MEVKLNIVPHDGEREYLFDRLFCFCFAYLLGHPKVKMPKRNIKRLFIVKTKTKPYKLVVLVIKPRSFGIKRNNTRRLEFG